MSYIEKAWRDRDTSPDHVCRAEAGLMALRKEFSDRSSRLAKQVTSALREQERLTKRLGKADISPLQANELNRKLTAQMAELHAQIDELDRLLAVAQSAELGGFLDLPLEHYTNNAERSYLNKPWSSARLRLSRQGLLLWLAALAAGVLAALIYLTATITRPAPTLDVTQNTEGQLIVTCGNDGLEPVLLCVPWPEAAAVLPAEKIDTAVFGLALYVQKNDDRTYRLLTSSEEAWSYLGMPLKEAKPLLIPPKQSATFILHDLDHDLSSLRVSLCKRDGRIIVTRQIKP